MVTIFFSTWLMFFNIFWIFPPLLQINVIFEQRFGSPLDKSEIPIWFSQSNGTNPLVQIGLPVPAPTAHHSPATAASRGKPHKWWKCFACHLFTYFREEERIAMTFDLWTSDHTRIQTFDFTGLLQNIWQSILASSKTSLNWYFVESVTETKYI